MRKRLAIIGAGGLARDAQQWASDCHRFFNIKLYVTDKGYLREGVGLVSDIDAEPVIIVMGDVQGKSDIVENHPYLNFTTIIHPSAYYWSGNDIGDGTVLCPGSILASNCEVGRHCYLCLVTSVGHDSVLGDFNHLCPGARVSGNVTTGDRVYIGSNAVIREKIHICDDVTIGAGAVVVKDITEPGIYVGIPARKK